MDDYQKNIWDMRKEGTVIFPGSNTTTFLNNSSTWSIGTVAPIVRPRTNATYDSILSLLRTGNYNAKDYFAATSITEDKWSGYYQG